MLVLAVVVHDPDFLRAASGADKVDFGFGDAVDAAAEAQDDFVGESVRDGARHFLACRFVVLLAEDLGVGGVARVEEPAVNAEASIVGRQRSERHHGRVGRCGGPLGKVDLLGRTGRGLGREALGDQVEDSRAGQVAIQGGVEGCLQTRALGIDAHWFEVGGGDADAVVAQVCASVNPVLGGQLGGRKIDDERCNEGKGAECLPEMNLHALSGPSRFVGKARGVPGAPGLNTYNHRLRPAIDRWIPWADSQMYRRARWPEGTNGRG